MNKITTEILTFLLKKPEYWDKKKGELFVNKVLDSLRVAREALWFDRMYFPIASRMSRVYRNRNIPLRILNEADEEVVLPIEKWYEEKVLCNGEELVMWRPEDELLRDIFDDRLNGLLERIWYCDPDWVYEEPTLEEMLAMGIQPGNIAVQASLF